jgi:hypothetical protein
MYSPFFLLTRLTFSGLKRSAVIGYQTRHGRRYPGIARDRGRRLCAICRCDWRQTGTGLITHVETGRATSYQLYTNVKMVRNMRWYERLGFIETRRGVEKGFARVYCRKTLSLCIRTYLNQDTPESWDGEPLS